MTFRRSRGPVRGFVLAVAVTASAAAVPAATARPAPAAGGPRPPAVQAPMTGAQADSILVELRRIRELLERGAAPQPGRIAPAVERRVTLPASLAAYAMGSPDAPVTLVEFTDYECGFCRQFHVSTLETLKREFIETGKLRFISRDLPLEFHKSALGAANAARCAGEQGRFWELRNAMIVNADRLGESDLVTYARDLGLDVPRFEACLRQDTFGPDIRKDLADAQAAGVSATPTFVLGKTTEKGIEGAVIVGAMPLATFEARIKELLAK